MGPNLIQKEPAYMKEGQTFPNSYKLALSLTFKLKIRYLAECTSYSYFQDFPFEYD